MNILINLGKCPQADSYKNVEISAFFILSPKIYGLSPKTLFPHIQNMWNGSETIIWMMPDSKVLKR